MSQILHRSYSGLLIHYNRLKITTKRFVIESGAVLAVLTPWDFPDSGGAMCLFQVLKVAVILANKQDKLIMNIVIIYFCYQ